MIRDRIDLYFRKSWIAKKIIGGKRKGVTKPKNKFAKKKSNSSNAKLKIFNLKINKPLKKFIIVGSVGLFIAISLLHIFQYSTIETRRFFLSDSYESKNLVDESQVNIMISGIENDSNGYYFVNMLAILSIDYTLESAKLLSINPNFISSNNNNLPIRSFLNSVAATKDNKMLDLRNEVQDFVGVRIDRYIAFDTKEFSEFIQNKELDLNIKNLQTLNEYSDNLQGDLLINALLTVEPNENLDDKVRIQNEFLKIFLSEHFGIFNTYKYFWGPAEITDLFRTDMDSTEFINFINSLRSLKTPYKSGVITSSDGFVSDISSEFLNPNYILIDEEIQNLFQNVAVLTEQAEVEVYNATTTPGLASKTRRELQNIGINIVKYGNYFDKKSQNTLYVIDENPEEYDVTINEITKSLRGDVEIVLGNYEDNSTGDLVLILGE